jgi:hypothetical protein
MISTPRERISAVVEPRYAILLRSSLAPAAGGMWLHIFLKPINGYGGYLEGA